MLRRAYRKARRYKRKADIFVVRNWVTIMIGIALTLKEANRLYYVRGFLGYGSEWMITPVLLVIKLIIVNLVRIFKDEGEHERSGRNYRRPAKSKRRSAGIRVRVNGSRI